MRATTVVSLLVLASLAASRTVIQQRQDDPYGTPYSGDSDPYDDDDTGDTSPEWLPSDYYSPLVTGSDSSDSAAVTDGGDYATLMAMSDELPTAPPTATGTDELFFGTDSADSAFPTGTDLSGFSLAFPSATDDSSFPTETGAAITSGDNSSSLPSSTAAASSTNAFDTGIPSAGAAKSTASAAKSSATKQGGGAAKSTTSAKPGNGNGNGAGAFSPKVAVASAAGLFALLGAMTML